MESEPLLQDEKPMSRVVYWLLGLLVVGAIFAASAFMYYRNGNATTSNSTAPTEQSTRNEDTVDADITQAQTDLVSLAAEIDQELLEIDNSLASTEDDTTDL